MMNRIIEVRGKLLVLLIIGSQLLYANCSRQPYRESSYKNIESNREKNELRDFIGAGSEKPLNTGNTSANEIIKAAEQYLGVPHCMGGATMKCMDCSGLLVASFAKYGIKLPHNSEEQARYGKRISGVDELKRGDLVFFIRSYKTDQFITHSGIYMGSNKFIHTSSKKGVTITSMSDPWWSGKFIFGTRVLE